MKLDINFDMSKDSITADYRYACMSLIKRMLTLENQEKFDDLYGKEKIKTLTFNMYFPNAKMGSTISVPKKCCKLLISSLDKELMAILYNGALRLRYKPLNFPNSLVLVPKYIRLYDTQEVSQNNIVIKTQSPILVRDHKPNNDDVYLTFKDKDFNKYLNVVNSNLLKSLGLAESEIELIPINANTTSVIHNGIYYRANYGKFLLKCENAKIANILLQTGIGSRRSQGFGMFVAEEV